MLDPDMFRVAASGLLPPEVIARLGGMTETVLRVRHGAEIAAAWRQVRGEVVRRLLSFALSDTEYACTTLLKLSDDDWRAAAEAAGLELCPHHQ